MWHSRLGCANPGGTGFPACTGAFGQSIIHLIGLHMKKDQILDHLFRLVYVVRNAACNEALSRYKDDFNQNYWILIYNNFLDIAVMEWCKIFGSNKEPTHWKTLVDDHDIFRQNLLKALNIDDAAWKSYWMGMKDYRDTQVAHHQYNPNITHYPNLNIALESSFYYYNWLISKLRSLAISSFPDDLKDYYSRFVDQALNFADVSFQATKDIKERVF